MEKHDVNELMNGNMQFRQPPELYLQELPDDYEPRVWEQYRKSFDTTKAGADSNVYAFYQSIARLDDDEDAYSNMFVFKFSSPSVDH